MADVPVQFHGAEVIVGFSWGVSPFGEDRVVLTLSHPRFGNLNFLVPKALAEKMATEIAKQLASGEGPPANQMPSPPNMH